MSHVEEMLAEMPGVVLRHIPSDRAAILHPRHFDPKRGDTMTEWCGRPMVRRPESGPLDGKWIAQLDGSAMSQVRFDPSRYAVGDTPVEALSRLRERLPKK